MLSPELEIAVAKKTNRTVSPTAKQETFFKPRQRASIQEYCENHQGTIQVSRDSVTKTWWAAQQPKDCLLWQIPLPVFRNLPPPDCILRHFTEDKLRPQYQVETNLHNHITIYLSPNAVVSFSTVFIFDFKGNGIISVYGWACSLVFHVQELLFIFEHLFSWEISIYGVKVLTHIRVLKHCALMEPLYWCIILICKIQGWI